MEDEVDRVPYFKFVFPPFPYTNIPSIPENWNKLCFFWTQVSYIRSFDANINIRKYKNNYKTHKTSIDLHECGGG